jgi:multidrug efflux pump subunit AcrA (membrane-fusion protein)
VKALLALLAIVGVGGATWLELARVADHRPRVWTELVTRRELVRTLTVRGTVVPDGTITVSTNVSGRVQTLHARVGQAVARGDRLVDFDAAPLLSDVTRAQAEAMAQRSEVAALAFDATKANRHAALGSSVSGRANRLLAVGLVSQEAAEAARADAATANAEMRASGHRLSAGIARAFVASAGLDHALATLQRGSVTSPIDGVVTAVHVREGQPTFAGITNVGATPLVAVTRRTPLIEVALTQLDASRVEEDALASVSVDALPGGRWSGRIVAMTAPDTTTALVDLKDPPPALRIGMSATATLTLSSQPSLLAVPTHALRGASGTRRARGTQQPARRPTRDKRPGLAHDTAWVVRDGVVARVQVTTGVRADGYTEVRSGLTEGEAVITGPYTLLRAIGVGDSVVAVRAPVTAGPR